MQFQQLSAGGTAFVIVVELTTHIASAQTQKREKQSLSRHKWLFGLESFLREHYTSSSESASTLAAYLKGQGKLSANAVVSPATPRRRRRLGRR